MSSIHIAERKISGILAVPALSLNNKFYWPEELERADGMRLEIFDQHADMFELDGKGQPLVVGGMPVMRQGPSPPPDGYMDVRYDKQQRMLRFTGEITNPVVEKMVAEGLRKYVSLRGQPQGYRVSKSPSGRDTAFEPYGMRFISAATTDQPGIPVATMEAEAKLPYLLLDFEIAFASGTLSPGSVVDDKMNVISEYGVNCTPPLSANLPSGTQPVKKASDNVGDALKDFFDPNDPKDAGGKKKKLKETLDVTVGASMADKVMRALEVTKQPAPASGASNTANSTAVSSQGGKTVEAKQMNEPTTEVKKEDTKEVNMSPGDSGATKLEATGPLSTVSTGSMGNTGGKTDEDLEAHLLALLKKNPAIIEQYLAKHPTLVKLDGLMAELKTLKSPAVAGFVKPQQPGITTMEQYLWEDLAGISEKIRASKATNSKGEFQISVPLANPPDSASATESMTYWNAFKQVSRGLNGSTKIPQAYETAISPATSGVAMGVDSATPVVVLPTYYPAFLRDTTLFGTIPQGNDRKRFSIISAFAMGALTAATQPSDLSFSPVLLDVLTTERGGGIPVTFTGQRKLLGPIDEGIVVASRMGEIYDEDLIIFGGLSISGISGLTDVTRSSLANAQYGDGTVSTSLTITSGMTMKGTYLAKAAQAIASEGYGYDGLVAVMDPYTFEELITDTVIAQYIQWYWGDSASALIAKGFIPNLYGCEIRRSSVVPTISGSDVTTVHQTYVYKKNFSVAMAATEDVMIESFRDIYKNQTYYKTHYQLGTNIVAPLSIATIQTA